MIDSLSEKEICLCAALRMADGYIFRGHRHDDCYLTMGGYAKYTKADGHQAVQGFLTSRGRFVTRTEAAELHGVKAPPQCACASCNLHHRYAAKLRHDAAWMQQLASTWRAKAVESLEESGRIRRTINDATGAEERCLVRAEVWDKCADELERGLSARLQEIQKGE